MIPKWLYGLMTENRLNSCMERDEHGRPIEEVRSEIKPEDRLASPGYKMFDKDGKYIGSEKEPVRLPTETEQEMYEEYGR